MCSTRDLMALLDALLKTESKSVLKEFVATNGLEVLRSLLHHLKTDPDKVPVLRKLVRCLEFLAEDGLLQEEHLMAPPPPSTPHEPPPTLADALLFLERHSDRELQNRARQFRQKILANSRYAPGPAPIAPLLHRSSSSGQPFSHIAYHRNPDSDLARLGSPFQPALRLPLPESRLLGSPFGVQNGHAKVDSHSNLGERGFSNGRLSRERDDVRVERRQPSPLPPSQVPSMHRKSPEPPSRGFQPPNSRQAEERRRFESKPPETEDTRGREWAKQHSRRSPSHESRSPPISQREPTRRRVTGFSDTADNPLEKTLVSGANQTRPSLGTSTKRETEPFSGAGIRSNADDVQRAADARTAAPSLGTSLKSVAHQGADVSRTFETRVKSNADGGHRAAVVTDMAGQSSRMEAKGNAIGNHRAGGSSSVAPSGGVSSGPGGGEENPQLLEQQGRKAVEAWRQKMEGIIQEGVRKESQSAPPAHSAPPPAAGPPWSASAAQSGNNGPPRGERGHESMEGAGRPNASAVGPPMQRPAFADAPWNKPPSNAERSWQPPAFAPQPPLPAGPPAYAAPPLPPSSYPQPPLPPSSANAPPPPLPAAPPPQPPPPMNGTFFPPPPRASFQPMPPPPLAHHFPPQPPYPPMPSGPAYPPPPLPASEPPQGSVPLSSSSPAVPPDFSAGPGRSEDANSKDWITDEPSSSDFQHLVMEFVRYRMAAYKYKIQRNKAEELSSKLTAAIIEGEKKAFVQRQQQGKGRALHRNVLATKVKKFVIEYMEKYLAKGGSG